MTIESTLPTITKHTLQTFAEGVWWTVNEHYPPELFEKDKAFWFGQGVRKMRLLKHVTTTVIVDEFDNPDGKAPSC